MTISQAIFSPRGELLLGANVSLTDRHVAHLRNLGSATLYLADPGASNVSLGDVVASNVRERATADLGEIFAALEAALAPARGQPVDRLADLVGSGELAGEV